MIVRDARPSDLAAVHRLIGQLADAPDETQRQNLNASGALTVRKNEMIDQYRDDF